MGMMGIGGMRGRVDRESRDATMAGTREHYAHSLRDRPLEDWQRLDEHLSNTADLAESFARTFAPGWGRVAGMWHDAGKYQRAFQNRIGTDPDAHTNEKVDHSSVGALIAAARRAPLVSFVIAGHHGGLPNQGDLLARLKEKGPLLAEARRDGLPSELEEHPLPAAPGFLENDRAEFARWVRFLFSALVDADFLDTEKFYAGGTARDLGPTPSLQEIKTKLDERLRCKAEKADPTVVNGMRSRVLQACRDKAAMATGAFSLTVPTGGGKTLASLAFALDHALIRGLRRVIVVIPFTSIIEQTSAVYRGIFGDQAVIEHHTNVDPEKETRTNRLASENWDAPIIVTTSVQFFESLFASKPSRCRKLHRIAQSVVVFDEVQTFPPELLTPVKDVLRRLSGNYGVTTVFCTATQPILLESAREIVPDPAKEFAIVSNRCQVLMPASDEPITWESLAEEVRQHERVLTIVNRRDDAQRLAELVGEDCLHLSARMCPRHRSEVLTEVRRRLNDKEPCRLVSTQLIEAGVDVDFPEVYRAFAGADSLAQAAGRCNREGRGSGRLHVFVAPSRPPRGILRTAEAEAKTMWKAGRLNLQAPETFAEYFVRLYSRVEPDARGVMAAERELRFKDVAERFQMIEDAGETVVAPYESWQSPVEDVRRNGISRHRMRRIQPFAVSLYRQEIDTLFKAGAVERIEDTFWCVVPGFRVYSDRWGFGWKGPLAAEPEDLIA